MTHILTKSALIATMAVSLAACNTTALDGNQNALGGATIGALTGSVLGGAVASNKGRGQRLGAILGGAAGLALGARLDEQKRALQSDLSGTGAVITNTGNELVVTLPESITFATGSAVVNSRFRGSLAQLARNINNYPQSIITVVGHTDDRGSPQFNQQLSQDRAGAVAGILISNGVNPSRISASGAGEFSPIASNASAAGRQQNRRVEVRITPTN